MSTASKVAAHKEAHPELYCPHTRCLWRTGGSLCKRHASALATGKPKEEACSPTTTPSPATKAQAML
jgi:hypothetical protein